MATGESIPLRCLEGSPAFPAHLRMKPASLGNLRLAPWVVPHAERPRFPGSLLIRSQCPDTSLKITLLMKAQHLGALTPPGIVRRNPQVPHTAREVTCHHVNNWRGKQSSIPPHKTRPDSPVRTLQRNCDPSQIWPRGSQERKHEFPASTRDEALFHCTEPSGVPRGPSQLHSIPDFSEAPLDLPEITGTSRGNQGFPAPTRKRPRESFFNAS